MRGDDRHSAGMFSYIGPEERVPLDHPLRPIRDMVDTALRELSHEFARALLLQLLYSVRSERQLMEQLNYNLLFRWFVGLSMDDPVWDACRAQELDPPSFPSGWACERLPAGRERRGRGSA
jgi:Transposase domain (DUF772)